LRLSSKGRRFPNTTTSTLTTNASRLSSLMAKKKLKVSKQLESVCVSNAVYVSLDGKSIKLPGFYTLNEFDMV